MLEVGSHWSGCRAWDHGFHKGGAAVAVEENSLVAVEENSLVAEGKGSDSLTVGKPSGCSEDTLL